MDEDNIINQNEINKKINGKNKQKFVQNDWHESKRILGTTPNDDTDDEFCELCCIVRTEYFKMCSVSNLAYNKK